MEIKSLPRTGIDRIMLNAATAAASLGIDLDYFMELYQDGRIPRPRLLGLEPLWSRTELQAWSDAGFPAREEWEAMRKNNQGINECIQGGLATVADPVVDSRQQGRQTVMAVETTSVNRANLQCNAAKTTETNWRVMQSQGVGRQEHIAGPAIPADNDTGKVAGNIPSAKARSKVDEKPLWQQAKKRMLDLHRRGTLPESIRKTTTLLKAEGLGGYNTVQDAAHRSVTLREHFRLPASQPKADASSLLDELSGTESRQFGGLSGETRQAIEHEWKHGDKKKAMELVNTLASNPDAGSTGDVTLIEDTDQDARDGDWSGDWSE